MRVQNFAGGLPCTRASPLAIALHPPNLSTLETSMLSRPTLWLHAIHKIAANGNLTRWCTSKGSEVFLKH